MLFALFLGVYLSTWCLANPLKPGGDGTHFDFSRNAFSHSLKNANRMNRLQFGVGNSFFKLGWVQSPASTTGRDGLGPTYNAISCSSCHTLDGRGRAHYKKELGVSLLFRISEWLPKKGKFGPSPIYGSQINPIGIEGVKGEARIQASYKFIEFNYPDGDKIKLRKPDYSVSSWGYGAPREAYLLSPRIAPQMVGLGLIESIPDSSILEWEDTDDLDGDGISGKANWVIDKVENRLALGRFGWKANQPNLLQQNAAAAIGDVGLTSWMFPEENCSSGQVDCLSAYSSDEPDVTPKVLNRITLYTQLLGVPAKRSLPPEHPGPNLFIEAQCAKCHRPRFKTADDHPLLALRNQWIYPYSDFLLHDMGEALADGRSDGLASGREWRTPPLWGIGLLKTVNGIVELLHDGRARNVEEAILWHNGEAKKAKHIFVNWNRGKRKALVEYINSL